MLAEKTARILVIDDEPQLRELLSDALGSAHIEVATAAAGDEAVESARRHRPDLIVSDIYLNGESGLDVIDRVREACGDVPAVVITGRGEPDVLSEASRRRPVEMFTKPLNLTRLTETVRRELERRVAEREHRRRDRRLRKLARQTNLERKAVKGELETTCADLAEAYRDLSSRLTHQKVLIAYQQQLLAARSDDDVFRATFQTFVRRSGKLCGAAMVCNEDAELRIAGRFGVPEPDTLRFCEMLTEPLVSTVLANPQCTWIDAGEQQELFAQPIRKYLVGVSVLAIPLMPAPGEMIGMVVLYRKGEQPFTDADLELAETISTPAAAAIRRNP